MRMTIAEILQQRRTTRACHRVPCVSARPTQRVPPLSGSLSPCRPFPSPVERGRRFVPPPHRGRKPLHHLLGTFGMLAPQRPSHQDPLHRLRQVQPRAPQRRVQRHDPPTSLLPSLLLLCPSNCGSRTFTCSTQV